MTTPPRIHIVSHRGGALLWAENSLEAFRNSIRLGVDWLECDVHLSSDGVPMVIHDATLDRTTEGAGEVGRQSAAVLSQHGLRPGGVETVPRLDQVLALLAGGTQGLQIEIKGTGRQDLLQRTLEAVDSAGLRHRCAIIAFDATTAAAAAEAGGLADVAWLFSAAQLQRLGTAGIIATAARSGVPTVETEIDALQAGLCGTLRQAGLRLGAWGANDTRRLRKALELELDLVATDDPALALKLLRT